MFSLFCFSSFRFSSCRLSSSCPASSFRHVCSFRFSSCPASSFRPDSSCPASSFRPDSSCPASSFRPFSCFRFPSLPFSFSFSRPFNNVGRTQKGSYVNIGAKFQYVNIPVFFSVLMSFHVHGVEKKHYVTDLTVSCCRRNLKRN